MNRTKILFFCAGAVLAALLVWWLSAGERTPAGESGKRSPLEESTTRTSIRAYRDCPVGADTVELLLRAAMAAPSAVNRQPWAFVVVDDRELLRELAGALPFAKMAARAPLAVVVCGDLSRNPGASGDWWVMDASAASENLLLAAHALGLGAVWTGVYPRGERVEAVRRVLGLPAVLRGRSQGHVERAVLEYDGHALRGLIVRRGFGGAKWVARASIALLGDVSVILRACPTHLPRKTDFRLRTVKDTRGLTLGCVTDVLISADNLLVSELEVSLGLIDDFRDGRRRIRHFSASPDGDVLVPEGEILLEGRETQ